jgi:DNA-binding response OmpR family regulator
LIHFAKVVTVRLLIAEDDVALNEIIEKKLNAEGYIVDSCFNGIDAFDYMESVQYAAAVLDVMMPGFDGIETVRRLRAAGNLTPVILLTARDAINDKVKGLDAGANDYLVKPFSFDELTARIRAMTRVATGNPTNVYSLSDLTLDTESRIVKRAGREIALTAREFMLLEFMLRNKNRVLSRQKIEDSVWSYDYEGGTNVVDVYIAYLRKKIDEGQAEKLIHTVRGIGYCLKEEA